MGDASLHRTTNYPMLVSCHFQGCKALLRTGKRRYIKYHAFALFMGLPRTASEINGYFGQ